MPHTHRTGFTRLADGDDEADGLDRCNIIFVHGLRGHPERTWGGDADDGQASTSSHKPSFRALLRNKREETDDDQSRNYPYWPYELLPTDIPNARIWTYGYDADMIEGVFRANNQNSVSQHGRDLAVKLGREVEEGPIIFVAHSLGGTIVKDAIYRAEALQQRTRAVVFLGTPHRGSSSADWAQMASNLAVVALQDSNKTIMRALKVDSEVLENIHEQFIKITTTKGIRVHSFQEARGILGIKGVSGKVVGDFSSRLGLPDELVETLDADHRQMAKCMGKDDDRYRAISGILKQLVRYSAKSFPTSDLFDTLWESIPTHDKTPLATMMICLVESDATDVPAFIPWAIRTFPDSFRRFTPTANVDLLSIAPELRQFFNTEGSHTQLDTSMYGRLFSFNGSGKWDTTAFPFHQSLLDWIRQPETTERLISYSIFSTEQSHLEAVCYSYLVLIQAGNSTPTQDDPLDNERPRPGLSVHCRRIVSFLSTFWGLVLRLVGRSTWKSRPVALHLLESGGWTGERLLEDICYCEHAELVQDILADISVLRDQINSGELLGPLDIKESITPDPTRRRNVTLPTEEPDPTDLHDSFVDDRDSDLVSEMSFALSIFSDQSLASTASSSFQGTDISEQFVFLLFRDDEIKTLYEEALERLGLHQFTKSHGRILKEYFRDLKAGRETEQHRRASRALAHPTQQRLMTELIARLAGPNETRSLEKLVADNEKRQARLNRLLAAASASRADPVAERREGVDVADRTEDESDESDAEKVDDNEEGEEAPPPLKEITKFLLEGPPLQALKSRLRFLAKPPHNIRSALSQGQIALRLYLESRFEEAAVGEYEWMRALDEVGYTYEEIADLLFEEQQDSPWIYFDPNPSLERRLAKINQTPTSELDRLIGAEPILPEMELSTCGISVVRRLVEELCGLGGVVPDSRDLRDWNGTVQFGNVGLEVDVSLSSAVSDHNSFKAVISRLLRVAERLYLASSILQASKFCSGGFTFLEVPVHQPDKDPQVWLHPVNVRVIVQLMAAYKNLLQLGGKTMESSTVEASDELEELFHISESIVRHIIPEDSMDRLLMNVEEMRAVLSTSSLAIQVLCIGLLSFSQAHTGNLRPFFVDSTLHTITLLGLQDVDSSPSSSVCIEVGLAKLTCLSGMTGGPVLVFRQPTAPNYTSKTTAVFDVFATPSDILNTWGPGGFVHPKGLESNPAVAIAIGGGYIVPPNPQINGQKYHWGRSLSLQSVPPELYLRTGIVIGAAISVNDQCASDAEICWRRSSSTTAELGTYQSYYETTEHQLGAQAGCDYGTIVVNNVRTKRPGATLKDEILKSLIDFPESVFNYYCGVRISYCTGVAQRVPITQLLGDLLPVFATTLTSAEQSRPWKELQSEYEVAGKFRGTELAWANPQSIRDWLSQLQAPHYNCIIRLIRLIINTLAATGLSPNGSFFAVAWPRDNHVKSCLRIPFDDDDAKWIHMLADAEDCATFAYITNACMPAEGVVPCRGPNPLWGRKVHLLETAVLFPVGQTVGALSNGETYFFLKDGDEPAWFKATVHTGTGGSHASLVKVGALWSFPRGLKRRVVLWEQKKRDENRIQERRILEHLAEEVYVYSRLP